jgi:hypothetical protein
MEELRTAGAAANHVRIDEAWILIHTVIQLISRVFMSLYPFIRANERRETYKLVVLIAGYSCGAIHNLLKQGPEDE